MVLVPVFGDELLEPKEATLYRSLVMRIAYLAQDRSDIQYSAKELARGMSSPTVANQQSLKRLGRYLKLRPRVVVMFAFQNKCTFLDTYVDSDWAGCVKTRKSTNGGALM